MDILSWFLDFIIHLDKNLGLLITQYGLWTYLILFAIIFCETGLVVMPFLPGDSLLFTAGAFAASGAFNVSFLFCLLAAASFIGDNVNYWVGRYVGPAVFKKYKLINMEYLQRAETFYELHGKKTIILARFAPVLRTFAPFVAGVGRMRYPVFIAYSAIGSLLWNGAFILGGYFFGNIPLVKDNFTVVIFLIIIVSLLPAAKEFLAHRKAKKHV